MILDRVCRPGSVIGPQQHFLLEMQQRMWAEGEAYRRRISAPPPPPRGKDVVEPLASALQGLKVNEENAGKPDAHPSGYDLRHTAARAAVAAAEAAGVSGNDTPQRRRRVVPTTTAADAVPESHPTVSPARVR